MFKRAVPLVIYIPRHHNKQHNRIIFSVIYAIANERKRRNKVLLVALTAYDNRGRSGRRHAHHASGGTHWQACGAATRTHPNTTLGRA